MRYQALITPDLLLALLILIRTFDELIIRSKHQQLIRRMQSYISILFLNLFVVILSVMIYSENIASHHCMSSSSKSMILLVQSTMPKIFEVNWENYFNSKVQTTAALDTLLSLSITNLDLILSAFATKNAMFSQSSSSLHQVNKC